MTDDDVRRDPDVDRVFVVEGPCPVPDWCVDCGREDEAMFGVVIHRGPPTTVLLRTGDDVQPQPATVQASYCQYHPQAVTDPTVDLEPPLVEVRLAGDHSLLLNPALAREFAAALTATADLLEATPAS